ncbi:MAG: zinc-binding alcohol dehydrogenase family protein, partial [Terriglobus roseus]|nr:zinc-binding alcohol dehydrogenase family protein [Terriglobus roseus]
MKSVVVKQWGEAPQYLEEADPPTPAPDSELIELTVKATGLHQLVKGRASGKHYSAKTLPHHLGVDGVGTAADGRDYYFSTLGAPPGTSTGYYSTKVVVPRRAAVPLPAGADPVRVAGLVNPGMSSWMALRVRVTPSTLPKDFTVVILNATSLSGRLA